MGTIVSLEEFDKPEAQQDDRNSNDQKIIRIPSSGEIYIYPMI